MTWAQSLGLKNARVMPIALAPGVSQRNHARASRFYGRFGIIISVVEAGKPPQSHPDLLVASLNTAPKSESLSIRPAPAGITDAIEETVAQREEKLMVEHGKELWHLYKILDLWKWTAIFGWIVSALLCVALWRCTGKS